MSDLWKFLATLGEEQFDQIVAITSAKLRQSASEEKFEKYVRQVFRIMVEQKVSPPTILHREYGIDQEWVIDQLKNFVIGNSNKLEFDV